LILSLKGVYSISYKEKDKIVIKFETENLTISGLNHLKIKLPGFKIQL